MGRATGCVEHLGFATGPQKCWCGQVEGCVGCVLVDVLVASWHSMVNSPRLQPTHSTEPPLPSQPLRRQLDRQRRREERCPEQAVLQGRPARRHRSHRRGAVRGRRRRVHP